MRETGMCLGGTVFNGPDAKAQQKRKAEDFMQKSKVDIWAQRGLGKSITAVDGFVEMFSVLLCKAGIDVNSLELERWLDCYYQLRYEAEKGADLARFVAQQMETEAKLEPIVPKPSKPAKDIGKARFEGTMAGLMLGAILSGAGFSCGPEVKDSDEKQDLSANIKALLSEQEYDKLSPAGKAFAEAVSKKFKPEGKEENNG